MSNPGLTELELIDSLFIKADTMYPDDTAEALLVLCFTLIPYREVPMELPFGLGTLRYPLPAADLNTYDAKNRNIPRRFLFDSPAGHFGDADKLAHFFGNASAAYRMRSNSVVRFFGNFVELFEKNFNTEADIDLRDVNINELGVRYGWHLLSQKTMPSVFITGYNIYHLFFYL
ncbi:MAG: hypothetical protein L6Q47_02535 [Ignavibacteriaceae bacterium]|nr:hypothetical protein [Ignavibacteriaceae bacterium]